MTKIVELIISEEAQENQDGVFAISLVEQPAIEENWVALKKEQKEALQCAKVDEDKRLLIAPALIPNKQIFRLDEKGQDYYVYFSKDTIKQASELFLKRSNQSNATLEHKLELDDIFVVESWIKESAVDKSAKYGFEDLPNGTWFVTMKVENDAVWSKVKEGEIKGFSIEGYFTDKINKFNKKDDYEFDVRENSECPDGFEHKMPDGSYMCGKTMEYTDEETILETQLINKIKQILTSESSND